MKQRTQILALGLAGALFAGVVGGIGIVRSRSLHADIAAAVQSSHALQASQAADMMHDAIRGDAQLALLGAAENSPERIAEAAAALKAHAGTMHEEFARLQALPLSDDSRQALAVAQPAVKTYIDAAQAVITSAAGSAEGRTAPGKALQAAFIELEKKLAAVSDSIESTGKSRNEAAEAGVTQAALAIGITLLLAVASMTALSLWLARSMARPMVAAVDAAGRLAQGDLTVEIVSGGNDETTQLLASLKRLRDDLARIVHEVKGHAESVATASAQIAQGNNDLSGRTEQQASALEQTAASMEQLGATVRQNADNAHQANRLAQGASSVAVKGGDVVGQVVETMKGINDSSRRIADIIGVIDGIAFQTNILALNAAVEAARAGEQGRGFAVVAGEVRSLAQRSAAAAREIKSLITTSVERVEQGTTLVDQAGATMQEIQSGIRRVTDLMGEISAASTEQSTGVAQVGQAVSQMDQATQQNAALVEQSAAAAESLKVQARELVQAVAVFRLTPQIAAS